MNDVYAAYKGNGAFYLEIPARDLSKAEFDALNADQQAAVLSGSLYDIVPVAKSKKSSSSEDK